MLKRVDTAVFLTAKDLITNGKAAGGYRTFSLKDYGVGYAANDFNKAMIEPYKAKVDELKARIVAVLAGAAVAAWFILYRTVFGLRLRAVGEHPEAADSLGISVSSLRYAGVLLSGAFCGLAAATLYPAQWVSGMTAGRGFIALAAVVFGRWHPLGAVAASLLFGYADEFRIMFEASIPIPSQFVQMLPYLLAIVVLGGIAGRSRAPAADGVPYEKRED